MLEAGQVAPGDDQVQALLVLDLVVANGRASLPTIEKRSDAGLAGLRAGSWRAPGSCRCWSPKARGRDPARPPPCSAAASPPCPAVLRPASRVTPPWPPPSSDTASAISTIVPKTAATAAIAPTSLIGGSAVDAGLVDRRVTLAACEQPAVDGEGNDARDHERDRQAPQKSTSSRPASIAPGIDEQDRVVDDLHDRDAERVRGQRDRDHRASARPARSSGRLVSV